MRNENYSVEENIKRYVLPVENGGTGVDTKEAALEVLAAIDGETVNQPGGVLGLNAEGYIDQERYPADFGGAAGVNIFGPNTLKVNESIMLEITNYDVFTAYTLVGNKVTVEREEEMLLVTGVEFGTDAWFSVNGSIFNLSVTTDNNSLQGNLVAFRDIPEQGVDHISTNPEGALVLASQPGMAFNGSTGAGKAVLYDFQESTGYTPVLTSDPSMLTTRVTYSGAGSKTFTANNQTITRNDEGYVDIVGAGNIIISATGTVVTTPGTPQQGLPAYPNGLPPYIAPSGNPAYPQGLPAYSRTWTKTIVGNTNTATLNTDGAVLEGQWGTLNPGLNPPSVDRFGRIVSDPNNLYGPGWVTNLSSGTVNGPSASPPYRASGSGWTYNAGTNTSQGSAFVLVAFRSTYIDANGLFRTVSVTWGIVTQSGLPAYPSGMGVYSPGQGNPSYPQGLPVYKPATNPVTEQATIYVSSENFSVSGKTISNRTVYPFENFGIGAATDVKTDTIALGCPRASNSIFPTGGEVIVRKKTAGVWSVHRITTPKTATYPSFGKAVKLSSNGNKILIGAPGVNKVMQFSFANNVWTEGTALTISGLATLANYGTSIDITENDSVMIIGAPAAMGTGAVYVYQLIAGVYTLTGTMNIPDIGNNASVGHKVKVVNAARFFATVRFPGSLTNYVGEFTVNEQGNWLMVKAFFNPSGEVADGFADDFDISVNGDIMFIAAKGNATAKGRVHIWLQVNGNWIYYKAFSDPNGTFGDGFGRTLAINPQGKDGHILKSNLDTASLGYYK